MFKRLLPAIFAAVTAMVGVSAGATCTGSPPLSDAQVTRTYNTFAHLLKESPAQQRKAWQKVRNRFGSVNELLAYARDQVRHRLSDQLSEEREYRREWASGCPAQQCRDTGYSCSVPSDCCSSICDGTARCR